jgi:hypothetical protein
MALPMKRQSDVSPRRQSGPPDLLSTGFSTAFAKMQEVCPSCNTPTIFGSSDTAARG